MLVIHSNPENWVHPMFLHQHEALSDEERAELPAQFAALITEITESGELVDSQALAAPETSTTVQVRNGLPVTTDGPFVEAKEHLAGYFVVECERPERAIAIAARVPDARFAAVEVRPIMDVAGMEM